MSEVPEIDVVEAKKRSDQSEATLLDVREPVEWEAGHAPGARFMPLSAFDVNQFSGDQPVVVICRGGTRSAEATEFLLSAGVDAVNVAGGMNAWEIQGQPVVRDDGSDGLVV